MLIQERMTLEEINKVALNLCNNLSYQAFITELFRKANEFFSKHDILVSIFNNMYPGMVETRESIIFGNVCGFAVYCFENIYTPNEQLTKIGDDVILNYWNSIIMDNVLYKGMMEENFGSGYNSLRRTSRQPILLDYVLSINIGNVDKTIQDFRSRIEFILTTHTFINLLDEYYFIVNRSVPDPNSVA